MAATYLIKGKIYTGHEENEPRFADALVIEGEKIVYVGSIEDAEGYTDENTKVLDCEGSFVSPGFTDGHAHISFARPNALGVELASGRSAEDYANLLRAYKEKNPDAKFVLGQGYSPAVFPAEGPTKEIIDEVYPDTPVVLQSDSLHEAWVNSAFLRYAGIDENTPEVPDGTIQRKPGSKEPSGAFFEQASVFATDHCPKATLEEYKKAILYFQDKVLPLGTVNVYEPIINEEIVVRAYRELIDEGKLKLKVRAGYKVDQGADIEAELEKIHHLNSIAKSEHFEINTVKLFMDGVPENHSAVMLEPYLDRPGYKGDPLWDQEPLNEAVLKILDGGFSIHVHAMGDGAVERMIQAFEYAVPKTKTKDLRNAITHLHYTHPSHAKRMADLNLIGVVNTFWHFRSHSYYYSRELPWLGAERADNAVYPVRSLFDAGVTLTQASDWPYSEPPAQLSGLEIAITRRRPGDASETPLNEKESMELSDMFDAITKNGAYQLGIEDLNGELAAGKKADIAILDKNPFEIDTYELHNIKVNKLFIDGEELI